MRGYAVSSWDAPAGFVEVPVPEPGPYDLLVRVHATSVNPVDHMIRSGFFRELQQYRFPAVIGRDVAGVVERLGAAVTRFAVGDQVYGFVKRDHVGDGTFADYVLVPEDHFVGPVPAGCTLAEAGVLAQSGITAMECLDAVPCGPGDVVLVNGAAGGVGSYAVQIAAAWGAEVVATFRTVDQSEFLKSLGAEHLVDWTAGDLVEQVRAVVPAGVDGYVDLVKHVASTRMGVGEDDAHREFARLCRGLLRPGGRAASVTNGGDPALLGDIAFTNVHSTPTPDAIARLTELVECGAVRPPVRATFAFDDLERAFEALLAGPAMGKISIVSSEVSSVVQDQGGTP